MFDALVNNGWCEPCDILFCAISSHTFKKHMNLIIRLLTPEDHITQISHIDSQCNVPAKSIPSLRTTLSMYLFLFIVHIFTFLRTLTEYRECFCTLHIITQLEIYLTTPSGPKLPCMNEDW